MSDDPITISRDDLRDLIRSETDASVRRVFSEIGLYTDDADERRAVRQDFMHLRRWREATEGMALKVGNAVLMAGVGAILLVLWVGFKAQILKQL
ncbi:hypothetical protein [Azorhizobium caulinodans]|uniref:hypothetical protein n=1 Tax=Azorhizobium caulinodans TaxID=7 RepID=UPI002FBEBC95